MSIDSTHRTHPRAQLLIRPILALAFAALSLPLASASAYADDATAHPAVAEAQVQATASEELEPADETPPEADPAPVEPAPDLTAEETPAEPPAPAAEEPAPEETVVEPSPASAPKKATQQLQVEPQVVLAAPDCTVTGFSQNTQENSGGSWINGALNKNNSDYAEGDFVPQKVDLAGLVPGIYTIGFTFDRTHNGKYAYDYVADLAISGSTGAMATWSSSTPDFDGPAPTTAVATVAVTITFTIIDATDATATITWGGHIASELDYGPGSSAGFINGAPYHFALTSTTGIFGCSTGNRDNQLMADAVDFATITVVKDAQPNSAQPFGFSIAAPNDLDADFDLVDNGTGRQSVTYNVPPGTTTITETPVEGWNLTGISCTPIAGTVTSPSVSLTLVDDNNVTCTFVNARTASLEVDKLWVINGGDPVPEGSEPAHLGLGAQLRVDGVDKAWDTRHGGHLQGSTVRLSEQVTFGNALCTWAGAPGGRLTSANGTATDAALPYDATLAGGANTYAITNNVTCDGALVLRKVVQNDDGGTAAPGDFTLIATPDAGPALSTAGSTDGTRYVVPADSSYALSEGTLPAGYSLAGIDCGSGSTTTVAVPAGRTVTCTFTNVDSPGSLVLDKIVDADGTGDTTPETEWHLSATPVGITGQDTIEGDGGASGATRAGLYQLGETGPDTHTGGDWTCRDEADATVPVVLGMVSIGVGDNVTCEITNTAIAPTLTLVKVVDPGDTGDDTTADAFTLTATPDGIAGQLPVSGNGSVTETVKVGGYGLSESGPSSYEMTAEGWTCLDGTDPVAVTDDEVQVGLAQDVVCTVTNVAVPSSWMVEKSSDPASGSTVMPGDVIDYTVTLTRVGDGVPVRDFQVTDTLSGIDPAWVSGLVTDTGSAELGDDGVITWSVDVLGDTQLTMTYSVTVGADAWDATLRNVVTPGPEPCVDPEPDNPLVDCDETTHVTPHHTLDKSVTHLPTPGDGDDLVEPGEQLRYTLTVVNDTEHAMLDTVVTDDLSDILDDAAMVTTTEELAAQDAVLDSTTLTWTITGLAPGDSIQLTYLVQVDEGAWGTTLRNVATPGDSGDCIPPAGALECETTTPTPGLLTLVKKVEPNNTGDTTPATDWHLSATPDEIAGQATIEGDGSASGAIRAGNYQLAEQGPATHSASDWECLEADGDPVAVSGADVIELGAQDVVTCEITNTAIAPRLTLVKVVDTGTTGDETSEEDFTLTATPVGFEGQDPLSGPGPEVTGTVMVGSYALTEDGPATYVQGAWSCVDASGSVAVENGQVAVGLNQDVVCTVTNTAIPSSWMVEKSSDPASGSTVMPGDVIDYTITVSKVGNGVPVEDIEVTDTLTGIDSTWVSDLEVGTGSAELGDDGVITWTIDELDNVPLTMTYSVTVGADAWDATLRNVVTPGPEPCIPPTPGEECDETTHVTPHHTLDKSVTHLPTPGDGDDLVEPGERLRYTLTVVNDTEHAVLDTVVTDDLSDILDDAAMVTTTEELAAQGAVLDATTLTWTITGLQPGDTVTASYVVQVDEGAWGTTLRNVATPGDSGECIPPAGALECETTTPTPGLLTLLKAVDPADTGDTTQASDWHLSATPDEIAGQATIEGDGSASGAIRAGSYQLAEQGPATHSASDWECLEADGDPVAVSGADVIELGAQDVVTCEITNTAIAPRLTLVKVVDTGTTGDETGPEDFTLTATPQGVEGQDTLSGPGPEVSDDVRIGTYLLSEAGPSTYTQGTWSCVDGERTVPVTDDRVQVGLAQDVTCTITNTAIPSSWRVAKTSDPASGSTVMPGDVINYTITVTKVGDGVPVEDIQVVDSLTGIDTGWVADLLTDTGDALLGDDGVITWTIDELDSTPLTMTYSVTVGEEAWNSTLHNAVTPGPEPCIPPAPGVDCDETTHFTPHHTLDKGVTHLATPGDGDDLVEPGEQLRYTLTVVNDTENAVLGTVVTDDLSDILDNASMVTTDAELAAQGLVLSGDELTWTISGLAPGASLTVSYVVQVDAGAWDQVLHNVATPGDSGDCVPPADALECETTTRTPPVTTMVVEKRDLETDEVLAGATFELYADEDNARDENGDCTFASPPVVGASDELLGTGVTGVGGQALFTDLQHGCYLLVETAAPPGYALPENPVMGIEIDEDNFVSGGLMSPIVVTDFAEGLLALLSKQQFELVDGEWVESDGVIDFGEQVKYVLRVEASGPKNFHDVLVTDFVPGWNPEDVTSTDKGVLVPGSAVCAEGLTCTASVDPATQLITWDLGDLAPDLGETIGGTTEFVVEFPEPPPLEAGESAEATLWNVGFLDYGEVVGILPDARVGHGRARTAGAFDIVQHRLVSNEVVISAFLELPPPAGTPPETPPPPPTPPPPAGTPGSGPDLPDTGSPAGLVTMAVFGGLLVGLGLLLSRRRRED